MEKNNNNNKNCLTWLSVSHNLASFKDFNQKFHNVRTCPFRKNWLKPFCCSKWDEGSSLKGSLGVTSGVLCHTRECCADSPQDKFPMTFRLRPGRRSHGWLVATLWRLQSSAHSSVVAEGSGWWSLSGPSLLCGSGSKRFLSPPFYDASGLLHQ